MVILVTGLKFRSVSIPMHERRSSLKFPPVIRPNQPANQHESADAPSSFAVPPPRLRRIVAHDRDSGGGGDGASCSGSGICGLASSSACASASSTSSAAHPGEFALGRQRRVRLREPHGEVGKLTRFPEDSRLTAAFPQRCQVWPRPARPLTLAADWAPSDCKDEGAFEVLCALLQSTVGASRPSDNLHLSPTPRTFLFRFPFFFLFLFITRA